MEDLIKAGKEMIKLSKKAKKTFQNKKNVCPECEQERPNDERVKVGMKCMNCAYGV